MVYDSIASASIPTAASNSKGFGKKKRVNRTAKLKQSKLDVRREQWLSQVKNKGLGCKEERNVSAGVKIPNIETMKEVKLEISVGVEENHYCDSDSPSNSPTGHTSSVSGSNRSTTAFTGSSGRSSSGSSNSSASGGFCSRSMTDEDRRDDVDDDDDDDCLDDWETMADALAAEAEDTQNNHNDQNVETRVHETGQTAPEPEPALTMKPTASFRAWRPDDASRPQCLPNLLKQNSFPMKSGMCYNLHGVGFAPSSCPICCEDLDMTDSSFLPCPCGYRLCLFCYKRILEDNGRCPGCRKQYGQADHETTPLKLARCYSMNPNPNLNPEH